MEWDLSLLSSISDWGRLSLLGSVLAYDPAFSAAHSVMHAVVAWIRYMHLKAIWPTAEHVLGTATMVSMTHVDSSTKSLVCCCDRMTGCLPAMTECVEQALHEGTSSVADSGGMQSMVTEATRLVFHTPFDLHRATEHPCNSYWNRVAL